MAAAERIRVLIAGSVYVKRALVRRFLEDDGYQVVGEALEAPEVLPAVRAGRPDAVVLDADLIEQGATIEAIRAVQPDARVVVFGAMQTSEASVPGADGYLEKGVGLSALTALLGRLFAGQGPAFAPTVELEPALVGAGAAAARMTTEGTMEQTTGDQGSSADGSGSRGGGGAGFRIAAIAIGALLIAWGVVAAIGANDTGGGETTEAQGEPVVDTGGPIVEETTSLLDDAYATLDELISALDSGNYILATVDAQALMDQRQQSLDAGFATSGLDAEVTARLEVVVVTIPARVSDQLAGILGSLYPVLEPEKSGGGSDLVLGTTVTNTGGSTSTGGTTSGGGDTTGGDGGEGGGGGGQTVGPGDGKVWGQSHKPPKGGWHGEKPHKPGPGNKFGHGKK
jgi:DNA-binding NarL/FixJ family response regulator